MIDPIWTFTGGEIAALVLVGVVIGIFIGWIMPKPWQ